MARVLKPESIPVLKTLCLAGESLTRSDLEKWRGHVDLKWVYGQSENTLAAHVDTKAAFSQTCDLGYAFAAHCWVVNPRNPHRLVPTGADGELLLQAPTMARISTMKNKPRLPFFMTPRGCKMSGQGDMGYFSKLETLSVHSLTTALFSTLDAVGHRSSCKGSGLSWQKWSSN